MRKAFGIQFFLGICWCVLFVFSWDEEEFLAFLVVIGFSMYQGIFLLQGFILSYFFNIKDWRLSIAAMAFLVYALMPDRKSDAYLLIGLSVISILTVLWFDKRINK